MEDDKVVRLERQWLSVDELAAREGVTPRTVYRWLKAGKVEAREDGDTTRYRRCHDAPTETRDQAQDKPGNASDMRGDGDLARHLLDALEQAQARELEESDDREAALLDPPAQMARGARVSVA